MQVAILNGVTMGGGAGVSIPGTFRVATDRTVCNFLSICYFSTFHNPPSIEPFSWIRVLCSNSLEHVVTRTWILQIFATPETIIGFHPDAGASFNLSHLPNRLGMLVTFLNCLNSIGLSLLLTAGEEFIWTITIEITDSAGRLYNKSY